MISLNTKKRMFLLENKFYSTKERPDGALLNKLLQEYARGGNDKLINVDGLEVETKLFKIIPVGSIEFTKDALAYYYGLEEFDYKSLIEPLSYKDGTIYRVYVHRDEVVELRRIQGDLFRFPNKLDILGFVARMAEVDNKPKSYTVDFRAYGDNTEPINMYPFMGINISNFYSERVLDMLEDGIDWFIGEEH